MNYNEFQETLLKELESRLDSHISLNPITTTKNNNTLKHGIEFYNDTSNISPVLYLDEWYEFYLTGKSLSQIAEDIVELYHQATNVSFTDTEMLLDYEKLEEKILYKLVNFKANQSLLKDIPHIPYLDLAIVFYVLLDCKDSRMATVLIRNEHLKTWGKDLNTVFSDARKNTPRVFPAELTPMSDFLQNAFPNSNEFIDPDRDCVMKSELFILSNAIRQHGATIIFHTKVQNTFFMLVENCSYRYHCFFHLASTFLVFYCLSFRTDIYQTHFSYHLHIIISSILSDLYFIINLILTP